MVRTKRMAVTSAGVVWGVRRGRIQMVLYVELRGFVNGLCVDYKTVRRDS